MKIGILGFGNLGNALAKGLIRSGSVSAKDIYVCDSSPEMRALAHDELSVNVSGDADYAFGSADIIFLVVKGHVFERISGGIDKGSVTGKTVVSFMAGMQLETLRDLIGEGAVIVRAMPSLAIAACDGVIGYTKAPADVAEIFHKLGYAFETEPENIEKVMAFSSCGLGFAAYLIDAFSAAGLGMGFSPETCAGIASRTFKNALDRGDFKQTVMAVATPGGATEQGIVHMNESGVCDIVAQAVRKAYDKMT